MSEQKGQKKILLTFETLTFLFFNENQILITQIKLGIYTKY